MNFACLDLSKNLAIDGNLSEIVKSLDKEVAKPPLRSTAIKIWGRDGLTNA